MPRSASNRTNSKSSQRCAPSPAPTPSPVPTIIHAPSHSHSQSPSMVDTMKQGFSFGVGSAIANNLFRTNNKEETPKKSEPINEPKLSNDKIYELYNICLEKNDKNIDCTTILQNNK
jgi:hypothetical protein